MIVYHLTPKKNAAQIRWEGLKLSHAVGVPRIWFFTPCKRAWAREHIAKHQHCAPYSRKDKTSMSKKLGGILVLLVGAGLMLYSMARVDA